MRGYGFPISDVAGNFWIGCEAIRHAVRVKENVEPDSLISDRILAMFGDDVCNIAESMRREAEVAYLKASSTVREFLIEDQKAQAIIKSSVDLLLERISIIDHKLKMKLPIILAGDLANTYKTLFPQDRLIALKTKVNTLLLNYGLNLLQKAIKQ